MKKTKTLALGASLILAAMAPGLEAHAVVLSSTDFEGFTTGSVDGQGGWGVSNPSYDQSVADLGGNKALRISNAYTQSSFGDMIFAPRPAGPITSSSTDPINSMPNVFAGESSTGATYNGFRASFDFMPTTTDLQSGLSVTISPDNGSGGRQSFVDIQEEGNGLEVVTYDVTNSGGFAGPISLAQNLSRDVWHNLTFEINFQDGGTNNDLVNIYLDNNLVHTGTSWEEYYRNYEAANHPFGVPVQTLLYRISGTAAPGLLGQGLYFDNVSTEVFSTDVPEPATLGLLGVGLAGIGFARRRKRA